MSQDDWVNQSGDKIEDRRSREYVDFLLAAMMARGEAVEDAAKFVGVSARTAYRRLTNPEFKERLIAFQQMMHSAVAARLVDTLVDATSALRELTRHKDPNIRLKASVKLVELALQARSQEGEVRCLRSPILAVTEPLPSPSSSPPVLSAPSQPEPEGESAAPEAGDVADAEAENPADPPSDGVPIQVTHIKDDGWNPFAPPGSEAAKRPPWKRRG